jgi:hypothetical protein
MTTCMHASFRSRTDRVLWGASLTSSVFRACSLMSQLSAQSRRGLLDAATKGITPSGMAHLLNIGRTCVFFPLREDLCRLLEGGSSFRIITGPSGSGKTHALNICEQVALAQRLVVARVEMRPRFRLHGGDGASRALISDLTGGLKMTGAPPGQGLQHLLSQVKDRITQSGK